MTKEEIERLNTIWNDYEKRGLTLSDFTAYMYFDLYYNSDEISKYLDKTDFNDF